MRGQLALAALALLAALAVAGNAAAAGGATIAGAPTIQAGVQQSEDTNTDTTVLGSHGSQNTGCWIDYEYWRLPLTAGDRVAISGNLEEQSTNFEVGIFPPGTTDANIGQATAITTGYPNPGTTLRFTAPSTGTFVLVSGPNCYDGNDGPFEFTVSVTPGSSTPQPVVVTLPASARLATSGTLAVRVHTSSGAPISDGKLELKLYGSWKGDSHLLATATPAYGAATFVLHVPASLRGTTIKLHVVASASPGYQAVSSSVLSATVS